MVPDVLRMSEDILIEWLNRVGVLLILYVSR